MKNEKGSNFEPTRRELLIGTGKLAAGAAVVGVGASALMENANASSGMKETPWGYVKLDPEKVAQSAYDKWYEHYCCYGVAEAILGELREKVGGPYATLPTKAFIFPHGGTVGWGTLCGTLMGAGLATSFAFGKDGEKILNDVMAWYGEAELPTWRAKSPKANFKHTNISDSPLCHISVGKWMKKEGVALKSPERKDRCAMVAASVAYHTVTLMNQMADGKFEMQNGSQSKEYGITAQNNCTECHGDDVPEPLAPKA